MSDALFPLPIDTPISDDPKFSAFKLGNVWNRFLKALSDDAMTANIAYNLLVTSISSPTADEVTKPVLSAAARSVKYVLNGNLCVVTYDYSAALSVPLVFQLPFTALLAFDIAGTYYPSGTTTVTIPAHTTYVRWWYLGNSRKQGAL